MHEPVGVRTRNGGSSQHRPAEESQRRKGNKHITMQFLEQGGYFDVPIQVSMASMPHTAQVCSLLALPSIYPCPPNQ